MKPQFIFLIAIFLLNACTDSFVPDLQDSRLTRYTNEGLGNVSAIINDTAWVGLLENCFKCNRTTIYDIEYYESNDSLVLILSGKQNQENWLDVVFSLKVAEFQKLSDLRDQRFILGSGGNFAVLDPSPQGLLQNLNGQIWFRDIGVVESGNGTCPYIAGTFGFEYNQSGQSKIKVHFGRFDFKVCNTNF